jgi:hypothetical protein
VRTLISTVASRTRNGAVVVGVLLCLASAGVNALQNLTSSDVREPRPLPPQIIAAPLRALQSTVALPRPADAPALLNRYCVTCHNERLKTGGLALDTLDVRDVSQHTERWEQVVRKLRTHSMPPPGAPRPDPATYDFLIGWLEGSLDRLAATAPKPGTLSVHRLNRTEYANAIRDLLALEIDGRTFFPADDTGYGFDNIADVLSVSPLLLERYLSAAIKVSRLAIGDPAMPPSSQVYAVGKYYRQDDRRSEDLPFGSRGGLAVRHYFPVDGEYLLKVYLDRTYQGNVRGLAEEHQLEVRINGERIQQFRVGGFDVDAEGNLLPQTVPGTTGQKPTTPATAAPTGGSVRPDPAQPAPRPSPTPRRQLTPEQIAEQAAKIVQQAQVAGQSAEQDHGADAHLFIRFSAKAGPATIGINFVARDTLHEGARRQTLMITSYEYAGNTTGDPLVGSIDIRGPYDVTGRGDTPSRRRVFACRPTRPNDETRCATQIITSLATRAYRRAVTERDIAPLLELFRAGRQDGDFDTGIQSALERILISPAFLFRVVEPPSGTRPGELYRLTDSQLASRLSFFLWSSIPDDELLELAARGRLSTPAVLERQVRRMLADPKSSALVSNFAGQWLMLRNLRLITPDPYQFPDFDDNLREALQRETELFFESQLRENRSVSELLSANYTFINERLAKHYGIPNVYGSHFRRMTWNDDKRYGLLGHGSILTITSYPNRTAPTIRGKFLLENILGTPPPPPPPDVPQLDDTETKGQSRSIRERLEQHRRNPTCATCHRNMDPLGFALENFDALGRHRTHDGDTPIDPSGVMPDGTKLDGPATLRQALLANPDQFVEVVGEKLLTYALGRGIEYYDRPALRKVVRAAASDGYRWSALVLAITESLPFRMTVAADNSTRGNPISER